MKRAMAHGAWRDRDHHRPRSSERRSHTEQADVKLTRELVEAGRHMKVTVHDHIIVGSQGRSSLRPLGFM
jgi:DNA repair protein RadC